MGGAKLLGASGIDWGWLGAFKERRSDGGVTGTTARGVSARKTPDVPNTRHRDQIYSPKTVPPLPTPRENQGGNARCLIFGAWVAARCEETWGRFAVNTPTILLHWILPVREIWKSDTHTERVCVGWRPWRSVGFHRREPLQQTKKGEEEDAQSAHKPSPCVYVQAPPTLCKCQRLQWVSRVSGDLRARLHNLASRQTSTLLAF